MKRLIIVGSPRANGRSAHLAEMLFEANIDECPEDELFLVPVSEVEIGPCIGCNACREKSGVVLKGEDGTEVTLQRHRCVFDDDMQTLYDLIDDVNEVTVVSPVYFSGAPAPMKCVLDRLQPYFWARMERRKSGGELPQKRPLTLHVLGEGGDPHGYGALVSEVRSAFAIADFHLERVLDWVGKIDESGEIVAEAVEIALADALSVSGALSGGSDADPHGVTSAVAQSAPNEMGASSVSDVKPRPKLNLRSDRGDPAERGKKPSRKSDRDNRESAAVKQGSGTSRAKAKSKGSPGGLPRESSKEASKSSPGSARPAKGKGAAKSRGAAKGSARQAGKEQGKRRGN